ncbi:hypothetical protein D3C85_1688350 [compost metagenome]
MLALLSAENTVLTLSVQLRGQLSTGVNRPVGDLFNEVRQFQVSFLTVEQGQRVALAAQFNGESAVRQVSFDFQSKW